MSWGDIIRRAQASVELLVILAVALLIFLAVLSLNEDVLYSTSGEFEQTKAQTALDDIASAAELVYQQGVGSKTRVFVAIPKNVQSTAVGGNLLQMNFYHGGNLKSVYRSVDFTVSGGLPMEEGDYFLDVESTATSVLISAAAFLVCGNNLVESPELCDGTDLAGQNCISQGFMGGTLACLADCSGFDTTSCTMAISCQQACLNIGYSTWQCRNSCKSPWNSAPDGDAYCAPRVCCCR